MGLDSYLTMSVYYPSRNFNNSKENIDTYKALVDMSNIAALKPYLEGPGKNEDMHYVSIEYDIAYWRKAYGIHHWFVENVQGGVDNCEKYFVPQQAFFSLKSATERLLSMSKADMDKDIELTASLIGAIEMENDWYLDNIQRAFNACSFAIDVFDEIQDSFSTVSFYYRASW